jgi:lysophospholipase L1-like esterase
VDAPPELLLKPGDKIVAAGDSITASGGYLHYVEQVLAINYPELADFQIINAGVSGHRSEDLLGRFRTDVIMKKPRIATINIGVNDVCADLASPSRGPSLFKIYKHNLTRMTETAQDAGIQVVFLAPTIHGEDPNSPGNLRLSLYAHAMREVAENRKCRFVDLHAMFLDALCHKPTNQTGTYLTVDGIHMRPLGNAIIAFGVLRALGVPSKKITNTKVTVEPLQ